MSNLDHLVWIIGQAEGLTLTDKRYLNAARDRLGALEWLLEVVKWCEENGEPVSGYILYAVHEVETK